MYYYFEVNEEEQATHPLSVKSTDRSRTSNSLYLQQLLKTLSLSPSIPLHCGYGEDQQSRSQSLKWGKSFLKCVVVEEEEVDNEEAV